MFKAGERVIHHRFGEGVLKENLELNRNTYPLAFLSETHGWCWLTSDGKHDKKDLYPSIYYVRQIFDMSKPEPEIGTWGYFWDDENHKSVHFAQLTKIVNAPYPYLDNERGDSKHFSPDIPPHIKELMNGTNKPNP